MKSPTDHEVVLESLTIALLKLMKEKPFDEISVTELSKKAGVGRVSFYRNYSSKQDILLNYLCQCTDTWWAEFIKKPAEEFYATFWQSLLAEYRKNGELLLLLEKNNVSYIIRDHISHCCGPREEDDDITAYTRSMLAGLIYGLIKEWVKRGMKDLPSMLNIHKMLEFAGANI